MKYSKILFSLAFLFFSCAGKISPIPKDRDISASLTKAKQVQREFTSLNARARVVIESPEGKMVFDQLTTVRRPQILKIAVFAPFGEMLASVVSDGQSVKMRTNWEEIVFENSENFRFSYLYPGLPEQMGVEDLVNFLLGGFPFIIPERGYLVQKISKSGETVLTFSDETLLRATIDVRRNFITGIVYNLPDGQKARIKFSRLKEIAPNIYFPAKLLFETADYSLNVSYENDLQVSSNEGDFLSQPEEAR